MIGKVQDNRVIIQLLTSQSRFLESKRKYSDNLKAPQFEMGSSPLSFASSISSNSSTGSCPIDLDDNQFIFSSYNYPVNPYSFFTLNSDILIFFSDNY